MKRIIKILVYYRVFEVVGHINRSMSSEVKMSTELIDFINENLFSEIEENSEVIREGIKSCYLIKDRFSQFRHDPLWENYATDKDEENDSV
jgi:hypothetical protein